MGAIVSTCCLLSHFRHTDVGNSNERDVEEEQMLARMGDLDPGALNVKRRRGPSFFRSILPLLGIAVIGIGAAWYLSRE